MSKTLSGKTALVTGASRGIGRAIAEKLASEGATVAVHYGKNSKAAAEVVKNIEANGGKAFAVGADLASKGGVKALFTALDGELTTRNGSNKFDILVNNAGIAPFIGFADTTEEVLDEIYTVNFKSLFFVTQEASKRLRDGGRIVSTSTGAVRTPLPAVAAYSALKAPLDNLTKSLAVEFGPRNITVNAVAPGVIDTDMAAAFTRSAEGQEFAKSKQALKRIGQPGDIADVVGFLASDNARWVTGQVIEATGGTALTFA
jgi:NAD(P)-dependent dehydrogenase (short-subunit alcohol dehydrogenase family)